MMPATVRTVRRRTAGFSLVELLIVVTMMFAITGAVASMFRSQSKAFTANTARFDMVEDGRGTIEESERVIRTMGAGTPDNQPVLVYGSSNVLAFNTDYIEQDTVDTRWAAYFDPDAPAAETVAWDETAASVIPNSSPSYTYPTATYQLGNGAVSPAETYIFYFTPDSSVAGETRYILYQRVNNGTPTIVSRNILAHPNGHPFFEYLLERNEATGDTLITATGALLPLIRRVLTAGISGADSANYVRPDSVRAVRMNFRITNGKSGTAERFRDVTTTIEVPNNGIPLPTVCGRAPLPPSTLTVVDTVAGSGIVWLTWPSSVDQDSGEHDVLQYILYRRPQTDSVWADPLEVVKVVGGQGSYTAEISGNTPGTAYSFGVLAQDCTPSESTVTTTNITTSVGP